MTKQQKAFPSIDESELGRFESVSGITNKICSSFRQLAAAASTTTSILERTLMNMSTRSKFLRSPTLMKDTQIDLKLQPLVCVQKIQEKDLPQKHWINNLSPISSQSDIVPTNETTKWNSRTPTTPTTPTAAAVVAATTTVSPTKTKTSPRKLRKPRGRWYRER